MTDTRTDGQRLDAAIREAAEKLAYKWAAGLNEYDPYDLSDMLYDTTQRHEAWAANKALEALPGSGRNDDTQAVQDHLEALRVQFVALVHGYFAKAAEQAEAVA